MLQTKNLSLVLLLLTASLYSCKTKKQTVEVKKEEVVIIPVSELFIRSCGNCHDLPAPTDHDSTEWKVILKSMQKRAHLTDKNIDDIYDYLIEEQKKGDQ